MPYHSILLDLIIPDKISDEYKTVSGGGVPCHNSLRFLGLQIEGRPAAMQGSCEYIE
jgi:hypothetical protein